MLETIEDSLNQIIKFQGEKEIAKQQDCQIATRPISLNQYWEDIDQVLKLIDLDFATLTAATSVTADMKIAAIQQVCESLRETKGFLRDLSGELKDAMNDLSGLYEGIIPRAVLQLVADHDCTKTGKTVRVTKQEGPFCLLLVQKESSNFILVSPTFVPFTLGTTTVQINLGLNKPMLDKGLVLAYEAQHCTFTPNHMHCPGEVKLTPNACLESIKSNSVTLIGKNCVFQPVSDLQPLILVTIKGTLIAQQLAPPLVIKLGEQVIIYDPVLIAHNRPILLYVDISTYSLQGRPEVTQEKISALKFTDVQLKSLQEAVFPLETTLASLFPANLSGMAYGILAIFEALLIAALAYCCFKFYLCIRCRNNRRSRSRQNSRNVTFELTSNPRLAIQNERRNSSTSDSLD
jgi:hypothetical protein